MASGGAGAVVEVAHRRRLAFGENAIEVEDDIGDNGPGGEFGGVGAGRKRLGGADRELGRGGRIGVIILELAREELLQHGDLWQRLDPDIGDRAEHRQLRLWRLARRR